MRAIVEGIEIQGTPQEIAELLKSIRQSETDQEGEPSRSPNSFSEAPDDDAEGITAEFAYRTLRRLPLSSSQKKLLLVLKDAHPEWVLASEIQDKMAWSGTQFGGVLGGLGRRLTATKGYRAGFELWNWKWDEDEGQYAYRLPDPVVGALDRMEL